MCKATDIICKLTPAKIRIALFILHSIAINRWKVQEIVAAID